MLTLYKIRHIYGPRGTLIRECKFAAKNAKSARIAYGKRYHVGVLEFVYVEECA
mgnify:CR=1 FL=1